MSAGDVDIQAALANVDLAARPALSPPAVFNSSTKKVTLVNGSNVVWGDNVVWGPNVVSGASTALDSTAVLTMGENYYSHSFMSVSNNVVGGIELNAVTLPASSSRSMA